MMSSKSHHTLLEKNPDPSICTYATDEKVLCYHGPAIYEAKILDIQLWEVFGETSLQHMIHYQGWKKAWDEWVSENRLLKYNVENIKLQKDLRDAIMQEEAAKKEKREKKRTSLSENKRDRQAKNKHASVVDNIVQSTTTSGGSGGGVIRKERKEAQVINKINTDSNIDDDMSFNDVEVELKMPELLKRFLIDDWDFITRQQKLVTLPRKPCVSKVLSNFIRTRTSGKSDNVLRDVVEGVKVYFEETLPLLLLYSFERPQFVSCRERFANTPLADIYGAEHLLRLFVKLPLMLGSANMDPARMNTLVEHLKEVMRYLVQHSDNILLSEYESPTPEYYREVAHY